MLWASFYRFKNGIFYTMNLAAYGATFFDRIDMPGTLYCHCNKSEIEAIELSHWKPGLGQGSTTFSYILSILNWQMN